MKLSDGYIIKELLGEYVLFPVGQNVADNKEIITLNKNGRYVLERVLAGGDTEQITRELVAEYHAESQEEVEYIRNDVSCYLERMKFHEVLLD